MKEINGRPLTKFELLIKDGIAEVILDRPDELNVMDGEFFDEVGFIFNHLNENDDVNVIILWAKGRLFTAGLDIKNLAVPVGPGGEGEGVQANIQLFHKIRSWQESFNTPRKCKKPSIAAIHNKCIGGGIDLITSCDIRIATKDAKFSIKETQVGIVADLGTLQRITKIVGSGVARLMAFTADDIDAAQAHSVGLVSSVYETQDDMLKAARKLAARIAGLSPLVVQGTKLSLNYAEEHTIDDGLMQIALWNTAFLKSDDVVEAMLSFVEKRPPKFRNRL